LTAPFSPTPAVWYWQLTGHRSRGGERGGDHLFEFERPGDSKLLNLGAWPSYDAAVRTWHQLTNRRNPKRIGRFLQTAWSLYERLEPAAATRAESKAEPKEASGDGDSEPEEASGDRDSAMSDYSGGR
jgi:hypothetical protein